MKRQNRAEHGNKGTSRSETGQERLKVVVRQGGRETELGDKEGR